MNNKLDAANTKLDDLAITVSDQGALNLRIHIEDDLADPGNHPLALFAVPEANGGHLNLSARSWPTRSRRCRRQDKESGTLRRSSPPATRRTPAGAYKSAYANYGKAYRAAAS